MSLKRAVWAGAGVAVACAITLIVVHQRRDSLRATWNSAAIRATLERVIPIHNDVSFVYVLENQTDSDYRVADASEVRIVGRSRPAGELIPKTSEHVSGEFPLTIPARRKVHFALVWTADREIEPAELKDFLNHLNVRSFVVFDKARRYQIELPAVL